MKRVLFPLFLILCLCASAKTMHWNKGRGYEPFSHAHEDGIVIENESDTLVSDYFSLPGISSDFTLTFRAANLHGHPSRRYSYTDSLGNRASVRYPHWGFFITFNRDSIAVKVSGGEEDIEIESHPVMDINIYSLPRLKNESIIISEVVNPYDGDNIWRLRGKDGVLSLMCGNHGLHEIIDFNYEGEITGFGFYSGWAGKVKISDISLTLQAPAVNAGNNIDFSDIADYLAASDDEMEGYWVLFDRELEESLLKMGGRYTLACVRNGEGYDFLYCEGASVNRDEWETGDLKLQLIPTPFDGIYDVKWYDSVKEVMDYDIKAQRGDGDTLLIQFPYQTSRLRLRKIP